MRLSGKLNDPKPIPRRFRLDQNLSLPSNGINDVLVVPSVPSGKAGVSAHKQPRAFIQGLMLGVELGRGCQCSPDTCILCAVVRI